MSTMNPLGVDGIEYVEYVALDPQSFGAALERLGFAAVARHRSREQAAVLAWQEKLTRVGFGAPDITALVAQLAARCVTFIESNSVHTSDKGAVTYLGGTSFEFVKSRLGADQ